ncbi:MAG TPA: hypothetical protein PKH24_07570 [Sedimentisphaerales bacterium]|jgi:hypothetical protein|nr:hypothetical protein [Sedimentisphaerales bacterium]HNU29122.1 hypothetical protein [Sedimentisphaerales bacterium]
MSTGIPQATVRNTWVWVGVIVLLPAMAYAGAPNTPSDPNAKPVTKTSTPQALQQSPKPQASRPVLKPGVRTPASFTRDMPLSEAIDILRTCTTPPLPIIVLWRDLDSAGIYQDTAIGIDGIPGLRLRQYLDTLVSSLSAGASAKVGYTVHQGLITIATTSALPGSRMIARVYDISDLTSPPSMPFGPMGFGNMGYGNYGGGPGMGYGMGSSYMPGGYYGTGGPGGLPGSTGTTQSTFRRR